MTGHSNEKRAIPKGTQGQFGEYGRIWAKKKISFLDLLLTYQQQNGLTDKEVEDEVSTFMFAVSWDLTKTSFSDYRKFFPSKNPTKCVFLRNLTKQETYMFVVFWLGN